MVFGVSHVIFPACTSPFVAHENISVESTLLHVHRWKVEVEFSFVEKLYVAFMISHATLVDTINHDTLGATLS